MSNIELTSGTQVAEDVLASPPGSVKAEHHSSDDSLAVGSDGTEVLAVKLYTYHGARRCPVPAGHRKSKATRLLTRPGRTPVPRRAVAFQTSNAGVAAPGAIFAGGRWLPMVVNNQHTTLELTLAVLDKIIQYGEVYGAVFNHFDQTTQTLKPYAVQCLHQPLHGRQLDDPGLWLLRQWRHGR
ncbi:hypothetical protein LTR10_014987 [Elasticomyces elasticus]|nr:hypothetical protein LTR10_014987 [Elasticomyces elasticus]KAK4964565.1 hypothetical protein LTR42_012861 [Elasticomyces elasticus]